MAGETVVFYDAREYDREAFEAANAGYGFVLRFHKGHLTPETAVLARGADAVCVFVNDRVDAAVVEALTGLGVRLLLLRCAGYNNVDLKAAYGRLPVARVPAYSPHAVAEHAFALLLTLNRKTHKAYLRTRENNFNITGLMGFDLVGKTAGVVGTGKIGRVFARIARGFGMRVLASDPHPDGVWAAAEGVEYVDLPRLWRESDVVSLHAPLTPETRHLVDAAALAMMKPTAVLINTSRGGLVDTEALIAALKERRLGGAGLDVYEEEDAYFFEDLSDRGVEDDRLARLLTFPNVLVTSHQGFFTREAFRAIAETTLGNAREFFERGTLVNGICYRCGASSCLKATTGRCWGWGGGGSSPAS